MSESIKISIERKGSLENIIRKVKVELNKWFSTLEDPFKPDEDGLRLVKFEKSKAQLSYEYVIVRGVYRT